MTLYNLKSSDGEYRITKFTNDLEVESSYIVSETECACPAGVRPTCRHRQMLPKMLAVGAEDSPMFYDFDKDQFFEPITGEAEEMQPAIVSPIIDELDKLFDLTPKQMAERFELPPQAAQDMLSPFPPTKTESEVMPYTVAGPTQSNSTTGNNTKPQRINGVNATAEACHPALNGPLRRRI